MSLFELVGEYAYTTELTFAAMGLINLITCGVLSVDNFLLYLVRLVTDQVNISTLLAAV